MAACKLFRIYDSGLGINRMRFECGLRGLFLSRRYRIQASALVDRAVQKLSEFASAGAIERIAIII